MRRQPRFAGSDREARGRVMAVLRGEDRPVGRDELGEAVADPARLERALAGLVADGLAVRVGRRYALPSA